MGTSLGGRDRKKGLMIKEIPLSPQIAKIRMRFKKVSVSNWDQLESYQLMEDLSVLLYALDQWPQESKKDSQKFPIPLAMFCPRGHQHIDEGEWATRPHKTHQCQQEIFGGPGGEVIGICGLEWRPAEFPTVGVPIAKEKP